jgi:non-ribosomal peptide synthetase component F
MDGRNGFEGICEYNSDLFDETTIKRLVGHYQVLVDVAVSQPDLPLHLLPILTAEERRQQQRWNQTQQPYPNEQGMHQWFESQVARTPDAAAITFQDQSLSYQKLNQKANQLAHYLQELGVGPDVRVGIHLERSLEMLIAVLAVLKSGGAYVPLDPALPNERLAYMVANADVQVLLTTSDVEPQISLNEGIQHIYIDAVEPTISTYPPNNPTWSGEPDNLAYIMYTSGSTGRPKGVRIPMKGVVHILSAMRRRPGITADDTLLAVITLSFDMSEGSRFWIELKKTPEL